MSEHNVLRNRIAAMRREHKRLVEDLTGKVELETMIYDSVFDEAVELVIQIKRLAEDIHLLETVLWDLTTRRD